MLIKQAQLREQCFLRLSPSDMRYVNVYVITGAETGRDSDKRLLCNSWSCK